MDLFVHLDALDSIALSGTKAEGWYVEEAKQAMQEGRIAYAGKYSAPDYEQILAANCSRKSSACRSSWSARATRAARWPGWSGSSSTASC